ncbi:uncharacterized protein TNCV_4648981 [Trichonephila clavipes]|uniref:Uncharacterized protein n=1 Tax=Trichonephila clavipes TaxID=2585209 RepID=A0A8X6SX14_TRICX|nr:uncharacterized protein TNCV_4648981 [Trichonephila clavipes]
MFLESLQHNFSLVTRGAVLLDHSISSWKNIDRVRVQLVRNDVQIPCSIHGLLYHNHGYQKRPRYRPPKHNTATIGLCMTYCTLKEQLFAWKTAYPDSTIGVMNDKP